MRKFGHILVSSPNKLLWRRQTGPLHCQKFQPITFDENRNPNLDSVARSNKSWSHSHN